jgi:uncharacterized LabA/DUF88 family protein
MKRVLVIVDVSNLYYSIKSRFNGQRLDYAKLAEYAQGYGEIYRAIAYGSAIGDQADKFKVMLRKFGFEPKFKEPKVFADTHKADWDVGMAMDIVKCIQSVDIVVLCTADGDLAPCLEWVESQGKITAVFGCGISYELKQVCHYWTEIMEDHLDTYSATRSMDVRAGVTGDDSEQEFAGDSQADRT